MEEMSGEGTQVRDLSCTLIPTEEVVFSVYEAPSVAAVRQFNERAAIPVSRIVEAIMVTENQLNLSPRVPASGEPPAPSTPDWRLAAVVGWET
jgi:hypothetical protein